MSEEAVIVQIPEGLEVEDLIELKYDSISSSIQLVPLDANFANIAQDEGRATIDKNEIDMLKLLDTSELSNTQRKGVHREVKKLDSHSKTDDNFKPLLKVEIIKNGSGKYECPYCDKLYTQKDNVQRHIKLNHENLYFECEICHTSVKNLKQHKRFKHKTGRQEIPCVICNKISHSKLASRDHLKTEHGEITVPSLVQESKHCPICNVVLFTKKSLWIAHIFYQHMIPNEFKACPINTCKKSISKPDDNFSLKTHLKINHDIKVDKIFNCIICPKKVLSEDDLNTHRKICHPNNIIQCPECYQSFERYSVMALHLFSAHSAVLRTDGKGPRHKRFTQISKLYPQKGISNGNLNDKAKPVHKNVTSLNNDESKFGDIFPRKTKYLIQRGDVVNVEQHKITSPISPSDMEIKLAIHPEAALKEIDTSEYIEKGESLTNTESTLANRLLKSTSDSSASNELDGIVPDSVMVAQYSTEGLIIKVDCDQINQASSDVQILFGLEKDDDNDPEEMIKNCDNKSTRSLVTEVPSSQFFVKSVDDRNGAAVVNNSEKIFVKAVDDRNGAAVVNNSEKICEANNRSTVKNNISAKTFMLTLGGDSEVDLVYKPFRASLNGTAVTFENVQDADIDILANNEEYIVIFDEGDDESGVEITKENDDCWIDISEKKSVKTVPPLYTTNRRVHSKGDFKCPWPNCEKSFVQKCSVNYHIKNVHVSKKAVCNYCNKTLSNESNLKEHIKSVHERQGTSCTWPGCGKILSSKRQMLSHFSKHSENPQACTWEGCTSILRNKNVLRMHIRKVHKKLDPWNEKMSNCVFCGLTVKTRCLNNHLKTNHNKMYSKSSNEQIENPTASTS